MVRSRQSPATVVSKIFHVERFIDHVGDQATRVRHSYPDEPISKDFHESPQFCFQVYSTIELDLEEAERPAKRPRTFSSVHENNLTKLIDYLSHMVASDAQRPEPIFDIYPPQSSAITCIEHQRREISYRKARRDDPATPLIPKVVLDHFGSSDEKMGFCIIITSDDYQKGAKAHEIETEPPFLVHFDRAYPSVTSWDPRLRLEKDDQSDDEDAFVVLPEKLDSSFLRCPIINLPLRLVLLYQSSYNPHSPPNTDDIMDLALSEDEGSPDSGAGDEPNVAALVRKAEALSSTNFSTHKTSKSITISNCVNGAEPDLRYVIYVPFLCRTGMVDKLYEAASIFTSAVMSRLSAGKTVCFEFHKPSTPALSSILDFHREHMASKADNYIGALYTATDVRTVSQADPPDEEPTAQARERTIRIYPVDREEWPFRNIPHSDKPVYYRTFIVVLDEPDFAESAGGVRFLLADGGKPKAVAYGVNNQPQSYCEIEIWRSAGMAEVTRRLAMDMVPVPFPKAASATADA